MCFLLGFVIHFISLDNTVERKTFFQFTRERFVSEVGGINMCQEPFTAFYLFFSFIEAKRVINVLRLDTTPLKERKKERKKKF